MDIIIWIILKLDIYLITIYLFFILINKLNSMKREDTKVLREEKGFLANKTHQKDLLINMT